MDSRDKAFYVIVEPNNDNDLAEFDTYEEAIIGLYKMHIEEPDRDIYIKKYITYHFGFGEPMTKYEDTYEIYHLGQFAQRDLE